MELLFLFGFYMAKLRHPHSCHTGTSMSCSAFTGLDPCQRLCLKGKDICEEHLTFYVPDIWFEKYIFSIYRQQYYFSSSAKIQAIYTKAILEGRITITREHFRDLETCEHPESLVDYYLLCCQQNQVDPLWSKKLFTETIKTILAMHMPDVISIIKLNPTLLYRFLDPLFTNTYRSFDYMVSYVLFTCISLYSNKGYTNLGYPVSLLQYINTHPKFNPRIILGHSQHIENLSQIVDLKNTNDPIAAFLAGLPEQRKSYRDDRWKANMAFREELSYAVWKPEMFLDHESYAELKSRWPKLNPMPV